MYNPDDTIAAVATPPGAGGIAVLRVSGDKAEAILRSLFRRADGESDWESHRLYYGRIIYENETIDEAMGVLMRAPRSYTREDVAELHCHGGETTARCVLDAVIACGARPAMPGEFTRRAFEHGRVDLAQAEAVMRLIGASGEAAARAAMRQMAGETSRGVLAAREQIIDMLAEIAACTDFPDEIEEAPTARALIEKAGALADALENACDARRGRVLEQGLSVVIAGRPNVGKSSLLNALLGEDAAIVTAQPGTTRDAVRGALRLSGVRVNLIDTAGLREADSEAERLGVSRARQAMESADLIILVLDGSIKETTEDTALLKETADSARVVVLNKADLKRENGAAYDLALSAKTGEGVPALREKLASLAQSLQGGGALLTQARHIEAAKRASRALRAMQETLRNAMPLDLAAVDAQEALLALGEITGEDATTDVLDAVFRQFCVGK